MLIPFGVFSAAGAGGGASAGSFELISTTVLGSSQASVTFDVSTYASTYKHLQIRAAARGTNSDIWTVSRVRFNGDTGSNYARHQLIGNGSAVQSGSQTSQTAITDGGVLLPGSGTTNAFGAVVYDILDAFSVSKNKTMRYFGGRATPGDIVVNLQSGLWISTSPITSIDFTNTTANWASGSRFSLYGIKG